MKKNEITNNKTYIKEYFVSIQGEGPYIGYKQLFIRFANCNLACNYCDTDFFTENRENLLTPEELLSKINILDIKNIHSISFTGGEPLLEVNFLKSFLPLIDYKIYLETNGTLPEKLEEIIHLVDIVSMDLKISSSSKIENLFDKHKKFIKICKDYKKELFLKVIFDTNITCEEIKNCISIASNNDLELILQPVTQNNLINFSGKEITDIFNEFTSEYKKVRLIPQLHKFIQVE